MEAEAEKERKMKKARISSNNDKKRKLEELYDAKLSDWLATARNGSSGTGGGPGGSCKRGSSPKYDDGSDNSLLASVGAGNDDIVLLAPRKQASTPYVNLKDRDMNLDRGVKSLTGSKYEGVNLKGYMASDVYHPVNEPYFKEEEVVSTEIFTINEDAKGEWSNEILKNANELAREETPDVPNSPDEFKPPLCTVNEECSDHLSEVDCSEDGREEDVNVDKPTIFSSAPEGGNDVMQEEKMVNLPEDKCLHATNTPEEGADVTQELEEKANLVVDESCVISNRSEEVTALVMGEIEEKGTVTVDNEGTVVSEGVRTAGTSRSIEAIPGSKQGVYTGIMNIPQEIVALAEEIRPVQQTNYVGECVGMSCIMEDTNFAAEVWGTNDGETTLDFVSKEKREISCIEEIGGEESKQMAEKDIKQKPEEAPQVDVVECGEDIALVEKDSEGENQNVAQVLENVVTDNNMVAVLSGFPEERSADEDKALNLAKKDAEDMHKEVVEVGDAKQVRINTLANVGAKEGHNEVAEVEHIDMTEANVHAQFDIEKPKEAAEVGHADMYDCKRSTGRDTDREPGDAPEVAHAEVEKARERIENNKDDKLVEFPDVAHAEMEEAVNLMNEYVDEKFEEVFDLENIRTGGTHGPMEEGTDGKLNEVSDVAQPETNDMKGFIKDDADGKFQEISGFGSIEMDRNYGPMEKDTDGKLNEVSDVAHPETKDMKDFITDYADDKFQEISEFESIRMDETHGPMEEDTDGKLKGVPEVSAEVEQANGTESDNDTPDCILQEDLPARGETRCLVEEDIEEDITNVPQVKHVNIEDEAPVEKDSKENPNADGKDSPEKEVDESKEVYQVKQTEGEEYKVLREKNTEEDMKDALGVKQAEEQQGETLAAEYMHDYIKEVTVVEHVDGQSEKLAKIGAEENPEEIVRTHGKEFDNDTTESLKNLVDSEILLSSASIESNEEQKEVSVENMPEKQYLQDVDLINERESFSDGAAMEIQGADDLKTLDMHNEVSIKQIHEHGMISENKTQILEDSHIVGSRSDDLVVMEVDEAWSTVGTHNQEALNLDKQQTIEGRLNLGTTIKNNRMTMPGHAIMPGCSEFQTDSPETKINLVMPTEGMQNQEDSLIKEELALEKGMLCKITEGNGRPLVATNILGGSGVDTTVVTVDVNNANCVEGIQNQKACSTEEARQDNQHAGAGDVRILEDTSTNYICDAGAEKDLCIEKDPAVLEKQDEGMTYENTERTLVDIDTHESGEVKHDGTMKMIHETDSRVQAVNMTEDKISFKNKQKGVPLGEPSKSDVEDSGSSKKHDSCSEFQTDSRETKINEIMSTEGIHNQEDSLTKEEPALENGLERKITEGNGRPLVVTNILGGGGVDTTVVTVDVNDANCVEGIQNQEACSTEARQDKQHTGAGDVRILEDTSTNYIVDAGTEKDLCLEKDPAVLEKQDQGMTYENTERTLVNIDAHESGEVKHDGTMKMIHETDSRVQAVNMTNDKIAFKNKQKGVPLGEHSKSDVEDSRSSKKHDGCSEFQTDSPETKINEVMSTEGIQNQEESLTKEEPALENVLERKFTEGNGRPLVVTKIVCGGGVDTTVVTVDVNKANCVEGIQNQEACGTEEARQDKQHTGAGDVRISEDMSTNCIGDAGEKDLCMEKVLVGSDESCRQDPAVLEKQDEGTTDENTERTLVDIDAPESDEVKHDGAMKMIHETDSRVQAVNMAEDTISFKNKQKGVPLGDHNKLDVECSGSNQTARKEFKGALRPDFEHEVEVKQEILEDKTEISVGRKNDEASEQDQTSTEDATIAPSGMDRGENNNEQTEEPVKGYVKYASDPVNTGCQTSNFGRPSIEEDRRIHSVRSVYLKDIKDSQGRIHSEPSNRTHINNAGYSSRHGVQEPVIVSKDIRVPLHDTVSVCGRDRALELVTGPPEETPRWRQEQHALNILEDVQNARIAEKTRMEMEIRILKAQIVSMQKQVMNMDHAGEVISRSKRH